MKKISFLVLIFGGLVLISAGCQKITEPPEIGGTDEGATLREIRAVIDAYLKATLGTIPGANVDYEKAKTYLTPELAVQFQDDSFIPLSYCIQDGPSETIIRSVKFLNGNAAAEVEGKYGQDRLRMWGFGIIKIDGQWKIKEIECLQK